MKHADLAGAGAGAGSRARSFRRTRLTLALFTAFSVQPAMADLVPEATYTTPFQIRTGEEKTFVGGTVISPAPPYPPLLGGTGIQVYGGTAILDPRLGSGTPIYINVNGNAIDGLYVSGGKIEVKPGGTYVYATGGSVRGIYNVLSTPEASEFDGTNVYVTTDYAGSIGLRTYGPMATTVLRDSSLTTLRGTSAGAEVWQGAHADLHNTTILTNGASSYGVRVFDSGSQVYTTGGSVTTTGTTAYGVLVHTDGYFSGSGTTVRTQGASAMGVYVYGNGVFEANGMHIQSDLSHGVYVNGGRITMTDTDVVAVANSTYGMFMNGSVPATITGGSVQTLGNSSVGVRNQSGAVANINGTEIRTVGQASHGIHVEGWGTINLGRNGATGTLVSTQGADADAVRVSPNATGFSAVGATLQTSGANAQGLHLTGTAGAAAKVFNLTDTRVSSALADGIHLTGGPATINLTGSSITGGNAAINIGATAAAQADIAADNTLINGRVLTPSGSTSNLSMTDGSVWQVTGDSVVTSLSNANSLVNLRAASDVAQNPTSASSYRVLQVTGNYQGSQGNVGVNTYLNDGGTMANQHTDRLLIAGNASGVSYIQVNPVDGSPGGLTTLDGGLNAHEGISLVQVAGSSTQQAFSLVGGYAVTNDSPYAYRLYAYGPGSIHGLADASQSLVGNGASFWDYRLQSAFVTPDGPVDPDDPSYPDPDDGIIPPDARPAVAPQVASYLTAPVALQYATMADMDSLHRRLGEIRDDRTLNRDGGPGEVFFRAYGGNFDYSTNRSFKQFGYDANGDYSAIQFGGNLLRLRDDKGTWRFGAAGTIGWLNFSPDAVDGKSKTKTDIYRLSGYATYQSQQGWYVDTILSAGRFTGNVSTDARGKVMDLRGESYAASVETGYPFALGGGFNLEPQLQLIAQHLRFDRNTDADGLDVNIGSQNQVVGRAGMRFTRPIETNIGLVTPYLGLDVLHGFVSGGSVQVGNAGFTTGKYGDSMRVSLGVNGTLSNKFSMYGEVARLENIGSAGIQSWLFNGGLRYLF